MPIKVIAFWGSPRKGGNTDLLLAEVLKGVREHTSDVTVFRLREMRINPCQNCGGCDDTGECVVKDAMTEISREIEAADRIILASPIFFAGLSAQMKTMIDRCQAFWCRKYLLNRPIEEGPAGRRGLLALVGGRRRKGEGRCAEVTAEAFFHSVSVPMHETLVYLGVDEAGAIRRHPTAFSEAREAGRRLCAV